MSIKPTDLKNFIIFYLKTQFVQVDLKLRLFHLPICAAVTIRYDVQY